MAPFFRHPIFNNPRLKQRYPKPAFKPSRPQHRRLDQSMMIRNQTHVSAALATHLLSNKQDFNVVFSPLSIQVALSVLSAGCKGETLDQLLAFLKVDTTDDLNSLYSDLVSSVLADGSPSGGPKLSSVNAIWVGENFSLKPCFKQVVDTVYRAACKQVDFQKAEEVADEVNSWAKEQTHDLIKEVITDKQVTDDTMLILTNAIYFKGTWRQQFETSLTEEGDFHLLNGNKVKVPFMTNYENQFVHEYDDFKVLGLPYSQGPDKRKFTMYFYLSDAKDGLPSLIKKIGSIPNFFDHHIPREKVRVGEFFIPKFKIEFGFEASDMLKKLGLKLPFEFGSRITEIVDSPNLYVSSVIHKSVVEVNEEGTEAAAVTVVTLGTGCPRRKIMIKDWVDFVADHPFLFVIREDVTGVVLFMGQVIHPS
ncbi:putative Serpin family protein [Helianthus annuus]|uniref:Putative serpin n=1 Tax=Helianthus annuus TaxID=4232 RepID=A0A251UPL3_HELAN|nr:serpin-ZX [Helianthus annuus]KAF5806123.1 putative Serpin family protein [Helianthus annuus]KAJ0570430.1 putative Serpin family protein [Helianthus annuus]KAJ0584775.1 putative Serpin family protein [Helianthus annuus]KAJ0747356.1 putative Serpin family protein [Helianthus annuus]KAJ0919193.1 putative Serpin family protein [Helianthus annuus]